MKPLAIDLFCGSFGWSAGWLELGGRVIGFDIEHEPHHGPVPRGADLVLQDVRTIDGAQFKDASLILASPPCQEFSYMAMPWTRAKRIAQALTVLKFCGDDSNHPPFPDGYTGSRTVAELTALFNACFRIQREAIAAAGHFIPLVVENVRGAQPWVGRSRWSYGSYHLWGDVPALMPVTTRQSAMKVGDVGWRRDNEIPTQTFVDAASSGIKVGGLDWNKRIPGQAFNTHAERRMNAEAVKIGGARGDDWFTHHNRDEFDARATKNDGGSWFNVAHNTTSGKGQNPDGRQPPSVCPECCAAAIRRGLAPAGEICDGCRGIDGVKQAGIAGARENGKGDRWFQDGAARHGSKSSARKAASARIARIPLPLARHIARTYFPAEMFRAGEGRR